MSRLVKISHVVFKEIAPVLLKVLDPFFAILQQSRPFIYVHLNFLIARMLLRRRWKCDKFTTTMVTTLTDRFLSEKLSWACGLGLLHVNTAVHVWIVRWDMILPYWKFYDMNIIKFYVKIISFKSILIFFIKCFMGQ